MDIETSTNESIEQQLLDDEAVIARARARWIPHPQGEVAAAKPLTEGVRRFRDPRSASGFEGAAWVFVSTT